MPINREEKLNLLQRFARFFRTAPSPEPEQERLGDLITTDRTPADWVKFKLIELEQERAKKYKDYEEMDEQMVELSSALDIHADFVVSSQGEKSDVYSVELDSEALPEVAGFIESLEDDLDLKEKVWFMARNLLKYGDAPYELVASEQRIIKLKFLPPEEIYINFDKEMRANKKLPYYQKDNMTQKIIAQFMPWELIHFKVGDEDYGVDYSLFSKLRRTYRVQRMLEDTLLVTRISRANQKGVWKIDVTGMGENESLKHLQKMKLIHKGRYSFDTLGNIKKENSTLSPQEDIYIPVRKDGANAEYTVVSGEANLGEIRDIEHFHNKLFAGTKVPKAYLGFEGDVNSKATLIQQNIAFVRVIKRNRFDLSKGLKKIYRVAMIMNGINPDRFSWSISFPDLGAPDEEAKWAVEMVKAQVVQTYGAIGMNLPRDWVVRNLFLGLNPQESDELIELMDAQDELQGVQGGNGRGKLDLLHNPIQTPYGPKAGLPRSSMSPVPKSPASLYPPEMTYPTESELDALQRKVLKNTHLFNLIEKSEKLLREQLRKRARGTIYG